MTLPSDNIFGDKKVQIVRHVGDLNSAYLPEDGTTVYRQKKITIPATEGSPAQTVNCAPMDNQFVYRHVFTKNGKPIRGWTLWCTCGSPAGITGWDGYSKNASPQGAMLICMHHANFGRHVDGSS